MVIAWDYWRSRTMLTPWTLRSGLKHRSRSFQKQTLLSRTQWFFKLPDNTKDCIIYHARTNPGGGSRNTRIQPFEWNSGGTPYFGEPEHVGSPLIKPSGETIRLMYPKDDWSIAGFSSEEPNNSRQAIRLIDDEASTYWIARYCSTPTNYLNHWITIEMGDQHMVVGFIMAQKDGERKVKELEILNHQDGKW